MKKVVLGIALSGLFFTSLSAVPAFANAIPVFSSGVDVLGNALPGGSIDSHYSVVELGAPAVVLSDGNWAAFAWVPNSGTAKWISTVDSTNSTPGTYNYRTTFDLGHCDPMKADISGLWTVDDFSYGVYLNGVQIPGSAISAGLWGSNHAFGLGTGSGLFVSGVNTLDFRIEHQDGFYDALRVESLSVNCTPEPGSLAMLIGASLSVSALLARKRSRK